VTALGAFLQRAASRPVVWGEWDCHLWLADWVQAARGGSDPAKAFRRRYTTPRGAVRVLKREGGSAAIVSRLAEAAGLQRIWPLEPGSEDDMPPLRAGDIGLLPCLGFGGVELIGAVHTGERWAALAFPAGIVAHPFIPLYVWRV
jgi:hypothetical protein